MTNFETEGSIIEDSSWSFYFDGVGKFKLEETWNLWVDGVFTP
jgi:hypothetical protein